MNKRKRIDLKRINPCLPVLALMSSSLAYGDAAIVPGFTHVTSLGGIEEYRLDANGLAVLIKPDHSAPVVTFQVTYRVGSRNEVTGTTGATHLLEHLMFKGTDTFNDSKGNSVDRYLDKVGAAFNATTWFDRTNYFATLGSNQLEGYIAIEADRMRNLRLREEDRKGEMTVVRNEYERGENNPASTLATEIMAAAYLSHPYHHPTIGWKSDIENVPIAKLREFYQTFYWPNNATVTIVGDVKTADALSLVRKYYGTIPRSPTSIPQVYTQEPPQTGPRRVVVKRAGELGIVQIAYKGPGALDADLPALTVLGSILSDGKNSRLSRALLDSSVATNASALMFPLRDTGLFSVVVGLAPDVDHQKVEQMTLAEIERIKTNGVSAEEVIRVISQYRAQESFSRDGTGRVASAMNEWIAAGDWTLFVTNVDRIAKVTPEDVRRVAKVYLDEDRSTTGWFVPVVSK